MLSLFKHSPVRPALIPDFIQKQRERSAAKVSIANGTGLVPPTEPFARGTNSGFLVGKRERERVLFSFQGEEVVRVARVSNTKTRGKKCC